SASGPEEAALAERALSDALGSLEKNAADYEALIILDVDRRMFGEWGTLWKEYLVEHKRLVELARSNQTAQAQASARGPAERACLAMTAKLEEILELNRREAHKASERDDATYEVARRWISGALIAC